MACNLATDQTKQKTNRDDIYIYNPTIYPTMISIRIIHWDEPVLPSTFKMGGGLGGDDQQAVNTAFLLWFGNICDFVDEIPRV